MSRRQVTSDVFLAIADPTRRAILHQLGAGEQSVTELAQQFAVTLSAISQHIRVLREVGLVTVRHVGRERLYTLQAAPLKSVADWVGFYEPFWNDRLAALETYLEQTEGARTEERTAAGHKNGQAKSDAAGTPRTHRQAKHASEEGR